MIVLKDIEGNVLSKFTDKVMVAYAEEKFGADTVDYLKWMSIQLYNTLAQNCDGTPGDQVETLEGVKWSGFRAWQKVINEGVCHNFAHVSGLNTRVFHPGRVTKYDDITGALEIWEREVKEYVKITGESVADVTRFGALCRLAPMELGLELHKLPNIKCGGKR